MAVFYCYGLLADKKQQLESAILHKTNVDLQLQLLQEDANRIASLDDWNQAGVVWLDELYDLTARFPDTDTIRLTSMTGNPITHTVPTRPAAPTGDPASAIPQINPVAKLSLNGITTGDDRAINDLLKHF